MRIYENGIYRDMTAAEIAELEKLAAEAPAPEPTAEERIAALEKDNAELRDALDALLTRVTAEPTPEPSQLDRLEAQVAYTALMTDTLMKSEG